MRRWEVVRAVSLRGRKAQMSGGEELKWVPAGEVPVKDAYTPDELVARLFRVLQKAMAEKGVDGRGRMLTSAINLTIEGVAVTLTMETNVPLREVRLLKHNEVAA